MVESIWSVVSKLTDFAKVIFPSKSTRNEFEIVFKFEILWLLIDHLLETFNTSDCHLYPNHHI